MRTAQPSKAESCALTGSGNSGQRGFSVIEVMIVVAIVLVIMAIAINQLQPSLQVQQADAAMNEIATQLRIAREAAITQRRNIQISFVVSDATSNGLSTISTLIQDPATRVFTPLAGPIPVSAPLQFMLTPGMPDTPDGFGNDKAVEFEGLGGGPPGMMFQPDGSLVDPAGTYINGTVFLGTPNSRLTARAVTVLGTTGRIRVFRGDGNRWLQ